MTKVTELTANTTPALTDVLLLVDDPAGTPASQKMALTYLSNLVRSDLMAAVATASATLGNSNAETTLIGTVSGSLTLAAAYLTAGKTIRLTAYGFISCTGTPTLNINLKLGSTIICATGAVTLASGLTTALLSIDVLLTCRTTGATGTVIAAGQVGLGAAVAGLYPVSGTVVTVDTTGTLAVGLTGQWSAADPANTLTVTNLMVHKVN